MLLFSDAMLARELTRTYDRVFDWLATTGPKIIFAILVLLAGLWVIRMLKSHLHSVMNKKDVHSSLRPFFISLTTVALNVALVFIVMEILGIRLTMFAAVIAAFGAAAGLALSGTLQNFASGVLILLLKPFKIGDDIATQGFEGIVETIQIFYTVITTYDNKTVIMPNSKLSNDVIVNVTQQGKRRLDLELNVSHDANYDHVKQLLLETYKTIPEIHTDPAPRIGVTAIGKDDYNIMNNLWVDAHGFEDSRLKINEKVIDMLHSNSVLK